MLEPLLIATAIVLVAGTVKGYYSTQDILHPMVFLGPLFLYGAVLDPWFVRHDLARFFRYPEDLNLVLTLNLFAVTALVVGALHLPLAPKSRPGQRQALQAGERAQLRRVAVVLAVVALATYAVRHYEQRRLCGGLLTGQRRWTNRFRLHWGGDEPGARRSGHGGTLAVPRSVDRIDVAGLDDWIAAQSHPGDVRREERTTVSGSGHSSAQLDHDTAETSKALVLRVFPCGGDALGGVRRLATTASVFGLRRGGSQTRRVSERSAARGRE